MSLPTARSEEQTAPKKVPPIPEPIKIVAIFAKPIPVASRMKPSKTKAHELNTNCWKHTDRNNGVTRRQYCQSYLIGAGYSAPQSTNN